MLSNNLPFYKKVTLGGRVLESKLEDLPIGAPFRMKGDHVVYIKVRLADNDRYEAVALGEVGLKCLHKLPKSCKVFPMSLEIYAEEMKE